ncbi:MAG: hypothetical protein FJ057_07365 [Cyanobacteria bacterium K_DeepCast_0m_m1_088]|nr:hypothetical protein [Cyanobacteria bacterium K_DeepCast_0m_m1_088]
MELTYQLVEQLTALEQQAAQVAALLDDAPPEVLAEVIGAFAPPPALKITNTKQRETWGRTWLAWIADCGERYERRPAGVAAGELEELILRWCLT